MNILTLSGWTQPADALHGIAPNAYHLDYADTPTVAAVAAKLKQRKYDLVIGWSLGGIIARELLAAGELQARALVSIAAPYQFVRSEVILQAMPPETFAQFYSNYSADTERTVGRFKGLIAKGDVSAKRIVNELGHHPTVMDTTRWLPWMDFLETHSAVNTDYSKLPPNLILHGRHDAIVPVEQATRLAAALPKTKLSIWEDAGHALHHHDAQRLRQEIEAFIRDSK